MKQFVLEVLPIIVAIVASIVGVVVTVGQLTSTSRLRKRVEFWNAQMQASELNRDHQVNQSFYREATARLIALEAYPGRKLLWPISRIAVAIYAVGATGYAAGKLLPSRLSIENLPEGGTEVFYIGFGILFFASGISGIASIVVRRRRLIRHYLKGAPLTLEKPSARQDAESTGLETSWLSFLGLLTLSTGTCSTIAWVSFVFAAPQGALISQGTSWVVFWGAASFMLALGGALSTISLFEQESSDWQHPRELSADAKRLKGEAEKTEAPVTKLTWWNKWLKR